jgi:predicted enzyme related to lactoylglutathione lyase
MPLQGLDSASVGESGAPTNVPQEAVRNRFPKGDAMTAMAIATARKPIWVDLSTKDAAASREFYSKLFGWKVDVNPDPQYGGYGRATLDGHDCAGISPTQTPDQPTAWSFYIGTDDAEATSRSVAAAGGKVVAPVLDVGDQGKMAVFQDPAGAFISIWQPTNMGGFQAKGPSSYGWAELNARGIERALPFYQQVFGWTTKRSPVPDGPDYFEFQVEGDSVAGATEMNPMVPAGTPSYWLVYFDADNVKGTFDKAIGLGARELVAPQSYPGGEFAILSDPQGAAFGLFKSARQS